MKKLNFVAYVVLATLSALLNTACTQSDILTQNSTAEQPAHNVALYAVTKDLLEIYDAKIEAVCNGEVINSIDLKKAEAYSEDESTASFNVDVYTTDPVEYKLKLTCCKNEEELECRRNYDLGFDAQFIRVQKAPEKALKMLDESSDCLPQSINGLSLQSFYGANSEFRDKTVYAVYAIVNSKSFLMVE